MTPIALDLVARGGGGGGPRMLLPLLLVLLLAFMLGKFIRKRKGGFLGSSQGSPLQILQERFANGEIDRADYEHRKAVLLGDDMVPAAPAPTSDTVSNDSSDDEPEPFTPDDDE